MYIHYTRRILNEAIDFLRAYQQANVGPNTVISYNRTGKLTNILNNLIAAVEQEHPNEAELLQESLFQLITYRYPNGVLYNAYSFGKIIGLVSVLDAMYEEQPKFFISHSSKDTEIVKAFIEKILILGCGFEKEDIFCTLDTNAIAIGADFRQSIIERMRQCDYIFLLISENYRKSEICHNEVGAAWALEDKKRIVPLKFPNLCFNQQDLGVLNVVKQAASINNREQLGTLYNELCQTYSINPDLSKFIHYKEDFLKIVNQHYPVDVN